MALRGGYKIIDLKGKVLQPNVGMVFDGIYDKIEETQKPILVSGLTVDTGDIVMEFKDLYANFIASDSSYYAVIDLGEAKATLEISDVDVVTFILIM